MLRAGGLGLPALLTLASVSVAKGTSWQGSVTPLEKVVQMMEGMVKKAKDDAHAEALQYAGFSQFCTDVTTEKNSTIATTSDKIEAVKADVQKFDTEAERLEGELGGHAAEIISLGQQEEAAKVVREKEHADYNVMRQNLTESVHALEKAISTLKAQNYDREGKGPTALLESAQSMLTNVPRVNSIFAAFLDQGSQDPEDDLQFKPEVPTTAYEFKSGDIVAMLEKLHQEFKDELTKADQEEVDRKHAYDTLRQDLKAQTTAAQTAKDNAAISKKEAEQNLAASQADLSDLQTTLEGDTKYVEDLMETCQKKEAEFHSREQQRKDEIGALQEAIGILKSDAVAGAADKHLPSASLLAKRVRGAALVQLRQGAEGPESNQQRAAAFLRDESEKLDSHALAALVMRVQDDPFGKVKKLIQELVERLMQEATNEATHKGWCDTELATNANTRKSKTQEIDTLRADIDALDAKHAQLTKDLEELSVSIGDLDVAVANATDLRNNESAEHELTIAEAQNATASVASAIKVLTDFYDKAAKSDKKKATGLVQKGQQTPPEIFEDGNYEGQQSAKGGVLGMLEVIKSDFQRLEADTKSAEQAAQAEYDGFMEDSSINKAEMETDQKHKEQGKSDAKALSDQKKATLTTSEGELSAAEEEYDKLKPACIDTGMTYEERVSRRKDEIEALKEALRILSGDDLTDLLQK